MDERIPVLFCFVRVWVKASSSKRCLFAFASSLNGKIALVTENDALRERLCEVGFFILSLLLDMQLILAIGKGTGGSIPT